LILGHQNQVCVSHYIAHHHWNNYEMNSSQISMTQTILCDYVVVYIHNLNVALQVPFYLSSL
jgi:hypothetical protein